MQWVEVKKLFLDSLKIAKQNSVWGSLAIFQIVGFFGISYYLRFFHEFNLLIFIVLLLILCLSTTFLWGLVIEFISKNKKNAIQQGLFLKSFFLVNIFYFFSGFFVFWILNKISTPWPFLVLISGIIFIFVLIVCLFSACFSIDAEKSFVATLDFFRKKTSLVSQLVFISIVLNIMCFIVNKTVFSFWEFSFLTASATIVLMFLSLSFAFFVYILNIFIIIYFLNIVKIEDKNETEEEHSKFEVVQV